MPDDYLVKQRDDLRNKLAETEEKLKDLKTRAKILFPDEMKQSYQAQISKKQNELLDTETELLERRAMAGEPAQGASAQPRRNSHSRRQAKQLQLCHNQA